MKMGKESELIKAVKENNRSKLQKLLLPDKGYSLKKTSGLSRQDSAQCGGRIRINLGHININCHEAETGYTPLIIAVLNGDKDIADDLIFHSADVNCQDIKGNTPMHVAVFCGKSDLVEMLLNNGAKVNLQNSNGNTPLHVACQSSDDQTFTILLKLLKAGAKTTQWNTAREMPIDMAAMYNRREAVSILLDHDPIIRLNTRALVEASIRGHCEIVQLLLDYGVDPNKMDVVKRTLALIEGVRFIRFTVAEILLKYGAQPEMKNTQNESAALLVKTLPNPSAAEKFSKMFEDFKLTGATAVPSHLKPLNRSDSIQQRPASTYPVLKNNPAWTKNSPEFCNSCTEHGPNTNLLKDDHCSCWIAPEVQNAWTVFDLQMSHTLNGITVYGWNSPMMVKACQLQTGKTLIGPWTTVASFSCTCKGSTNASDSGTPQTFADFYASSRFWRFEVLSNHGGKCICFHGIQFHGIDYRLTELLDHVLLKQHTKEIIEQGFNTYRRFLLIEEDTLKDIVKNDDQIQEVKELIEKRKKIEFQVKTLKWRVLPVATVKEGEIIADFVVESDPGLEEELQLILDDDVKVSGVTCISLIPGLEDNPSTATFSGIQINTCGKHKLIIQCVKHPDIVLESPDYIDVKHKAGMRDSVSQTFDELEAMLKDLQASLDPVQQ
ncbi:hypothetical protein ACJMK2_017192 [Sinanodonta woodiana]|uniref:Uncharacterized protein n=1 Tax=Sinanodonta woodiana TaxID=1069815 RepID=A0ABD3UW48_SINWO